MELGIQFPGQIRCNVNIGSPLIRQFLYAMSQRQILSKQTYNQWCEKYFEANQVQVSKYRYLGENYLL